MSSSARGAHVFLDYAEFFPHDGFDGNQMLQIMQDEMLLGNLVHLLALTLDRGTLH